VEAGVSVTEKFSELLPNVAVISAGVLVLTAPVVTVNFALDEPAVISTDPGTVAAEAPLERLMVVVPEAAALNVTVQLDVAGGVTLVGLQFSVESTGAVG